MSLIITEFIHEGKTLYRTESGTLYDKDFNLEFENTLNRNKHIQTKVIQSKEKETNQSLKNTEQLNSLHTLKETMSFNANQVFNDFLSELFDHMSKNFSGKEFTQEDLLKAYLSEEASIGKKKKKKAKVKKPTKVQPFAMFCKNETHKSAIKKECARRKGEGEDGAHFLTVARMFFNALDDKEKSVFQDLADEENVKNGSVPPSENTVASNDVTVAA